MEDLITLIIFLLFVGGSLMNSVSQAKKRREAELAESLREEEDRVVKEPAPPLPTPKPIVPKAKQVTAKSGWDELKKQLEQVLKDAEISPKTSPVATPEPVLPKPRSRPAVKRRPPSSPKQPADRKVSRPLLPGRKPPVRKAKAPAPVRTESAKEVWAREKREYHEELLRQRQTDVRLRKPEPALSKQPRSLSGRARKAGFPYLHPNPIANAVILSEVLRPYSRGHARVRRTFY